MFSIFFIFYLSFFPYIISNNGKLVVNNEQKVQLDKNSHAVYLRPIQIVVKQLDGKTKIYDINVSSVIMYTDYENLQLRVACGTMHTAQGPEPYTYWYIMVRDREFNNLKLFAEVEDIITKAGLNNQGRIFLHNDISCNSYN